MGFFDFLSGDDQLELNVEGLTEALNDLELTVNQIKTEKNVERLISEHLLKYFDDVFTQYNVGGYLGLKIDIDIGNGNFGIELKLASSLKKSVEVQRLLGQTIYYKKRKYDNDNLLILIVGDEKNQRELIIKEVTDFIVDELDVDVLYFKAVSKRTK